MVTKICKKFDILKRLLSFNFNEVSLKIRGRFLFNVLNTAVLNIAEQCEFFFLILTLKESWKTERSESDRLNFNVRKILISTDILCSLGGCPFAILLRTENLFYFQAFIPNQIFRSLRPPFYIFGLRSP